MSSVRAISVFLELKISERRNAFTAFGRSFVCFQTDALQPHAEAAAIVEPDPMNGSRIIPSLIGRDASRFAGESAAA